MRPEPAQTASCFISDKRARPTLPTTPSAPGQCLVFDVCYLDTICLKGEDLARAPTL